MVQRNLYPYNSRTILCMQPQCIQQAHCTECDDNENDFRISGTGMDLTEETVTYDVRCRCGEESTISLTPDGIDAPDTISYEEASWA